MIWNFCYTLTLQSTIYEVGVPTLHHPYTGLIQGNSPVGKRGVACHKCISLPFAKYVTDKPFFVVGMRYVHYEMLAGMLQCRPAL